jgi:hypothetical protein
MLFFSLWSGSSQLIILIDNRDGMKKWWCVMCLMVVICIPLSAQEGLAVRLAEAEALYSAEPGIWASDAYSAAVALRKNFTTGCYADKRFMTDLGYMSVVFSGLVANQPLQLSFSREGTNAFSQSRMLFSAGRKIGKIIQLGINAGYALKNARGYGASGEIIAGAGLMMQLNEHVRIGIQLNQLNDLSEKNEFRFLFRTGIGYYISEICSLTIELKKETGKSVVVDAGWFYAFHPNLYGRLGYSPALSLFSFNIGYLNGPFRVEAGQAIHLTLGATWGLSFTYSVNRSE